MKIGCQNFVSSVFVAYLLKWPLETGSSFKKIVSDFEHIYLLLKNQYVSYIRE